MKNYVGIDLGTTNSAICSYDRSNTRIWKSPEQNDVTPSALYINDRGNKYVGKRAYDSAPHKPNNAAVLFKRLMGTSTPISLKALDIVMTPEECSAEVLKVLYGYLPEEIRNDAETGSVVTVPAAFNQMQKDATMQAALMAGIGEVALMQEPVAAVMSVMRKRKTDGIFMIYDLGGGTLDIAVAQSLAGRVDLLAHGGIAMCGGRDFDRVLVDNVVKPWLIENFDLPVDMAANPKFASLIRLGAWAVERAKIELSSREEAVISLSEVEARITDQSGSEIYLDIPLDRRTFEKLIEARINESVGAAKDTLMKAGLSPHELDRVVFIGGPTNYEPLQEMVAFELSVPRSSDVNPMTAVAEGASIFAESVDWDSQNHARKKTRAQISATGPIQVTFDYTARTTASRAKIGVLLPEAPAPGAEFQIDSMDTGWSSGRLPLEHGASLDVELSQPGENLFKTFVFEASGQPISLKQDSIEIIRTAAAVEAIPVSHSVGLEVLDKLGGRPTVDWLARAGDSLPKKGTKVFRAGEALSAGASTSLNFKLWEGEIETPISDNRPIGVLKISGNDFSEGEILAGAELHCVYEILDSGNVVLEVSVPSISGTFHSGHNFYSRREGQLDFSSSAAHVIEEGERTMSRIDEIDEIVESPKLVQAKEKLAPAAALELGENETEVAQEAMESVYEARRLLAQVRREHLKEIRQLDMAHVKNYFDEYVRELARPSEETAFDNLAMTAQRAIDKNDKGFENLLDEMREKNYDILLRQDWFIVEIFNDMAKAPHQFIDKIRYEELINAGSAHARADDIGNLKKVIGELYSIKIETGVDEVNLESVNIIR